MCGTWLIYMWDVTHWYVGHDVFICWIQPVDVGGVTTDGRGGGHESCHTWISHISCMIWRKIRGKWLNFMGDMTYLRCDSGATAIATIGSLHMTHQYVGYSSLMCGTWLINIWDMTRSYVWHDSLISGTWLNHMWDMTQSYVWHDSFINVTWLIHKFDMTHSYVGHVSIICGTWLNHMCDMTH